MCSFDHSVTRNGTSFRVVLRPGGCPSPPFYYLYGVSLGKLPPGAYHVEVVEHTNVPPHVLSFFVFEADPVVVVRPFVVPTGTNGFPIHLVFDETFDICGGDANCDPVIEIGGVAYRNKNMLPRRAGIWFYAPNLAPGLHDIRIVNSKGTTTVPGAIYYQASGSAPDRGIFERVLFPVLFRSPGRNGSEWRTEAVISNATEYEITNANSVGAPVRLEPQSRHAFSGEQYPNGVALMVPRREAENLAFRLRIRDVSRESDSFGTEVPVVRESQMFRNQELTLLDVPLDPRYRTKLRLYFLADAEDALEPRGFNVWVVPAGGGSPFNLFTLLTRACSGVACAWTPLYGEIDIPARMNGERADLYLQRVIGGLQWAFASVTNNKTQEVTLVTPDGRGGRP